MTTQEELDADKFRITFGRGFHIVRNGVALSVQFGYGNYCNNRDNKKTWPLTNELNTDVNSPNAEIALFQTKNGKWLTRKIMKRVNGQDVGDDVIGYITTAGVLEVIADLLQNEWKPKKKGAKV